MIKRLKHGDTAIIFRNGKFHAAVVVTHSYRNAGQKHQVDVKFPGSDLICTFTNNTNLTSYLDLDLTWKINNSKLVKLPS